MRTRSAAPLLLAALGLVACGEPGDVPAEREPAEAAGSSATQPATPVREAPPPTPITTAALHERTVERGAPATVVNIWATWCVPCRKEMPALLRLREERADDGLELVLVSADFDLTPEEIAAQLTELGVDFPTFLKAEGDQAFIDGLSEDWQGALPATFVYDSEGRLQAFFEGAQPHSVFDEAVESVLDGRG